MEDQNQTMPKPRRAMLTKELGYMEAMGVHDQRGRCRCEWCKKPPRDGLWVRTSSIGGGMCIDSSPMCLNCADKKSIPYTIPEKD